MHITLDMILRYADTELHEEDVEAYPRDGIPVEDFINKYNKLPIADMQMIVAMAKEESENNDK